MDHYGPIPGEQPQSGGIDKVGLFLIAAFVAATMGYYLLYFAPRQRAWAKQQIALEQKKAEEAAAEAEREAKRKAAIAATDSASTAAAGSGAVAAQGSAAVAKGPGTPGPAGPEPAPEAVDHPLKTFAFGGEEQQIELTTAGASVRGLTLTQFKESTYAADQSAEEDKREQKAFRFLTHYLDEVRSFGVEPKSADFKRAAKANWEHSEIDGGHRFSLALGEGWTLEKDFLIPTAKAPPEGKTLKKEQRLFHFELVVRVRNDNEAKRPFAYYLNGPAGVVNQDVGRSSYGREGVVAFRDTDGRVKEEMEATTGYEHETFKVDTVYEANAEREIAYYGLVTKYFASIVVPQGETKVAAAESWSLLGKIGRKATAQETELSDKGKDSPATQGFLRGLVELEVPANEALEQRYMIYAGPRQEDWVFEQPTYAGLGLNELVYYGWGIFAPIGRVLHAILSFFHWIFGNWGVAILCLTVMVRVLILPLSLVQQRSMLGMQKLGPEMNLVKEKYTKADGTMTREHQLAFQQEQMELFRKHGVNPIGCVGPMLLQMPIFFALYNVSNYVADLRGAPFFGWITDLSNPDVLFRMPFTLPILGTNAFSVLPLLMVGTYILQQKIQPTPTDPKAAEQQKMMKFILPVFGLLFYTFPSGLLIYFAASSLWGIGEQKFIKNKMFPPDEPETGAKEAAKKAAAPMPGLASVGKEPEPVAAEAPASSGGDAGGKKGKKNKKKGKGKKGKRR